MKPALRVGTLIPLRPEYDADIKHARELGFESGQISVWDMSFYTDENARALRSSLDRHGFELTALWCGWSGPVDWKYPNMYDTLGLAPAYLRARRIEDLIAGSRFAKALGVSDIVTHAGFLPDNPFDQNRAQIVQALRHIAKECEANGQRLLFETGEELPVTLLRYFEDIGAGNLGVNFDPANLLMNGRANPSDALRMLAPFVMGFHAKDGTYPERTQPKGVQKRVGEGQADFGALIRILVETGYCGDITIEREIEAGPERDKDWRDAKAYIEKLRENME